MKFHSQERVGMANGVKRSVDSTAVDLSIPGNACSLSHYTLAISGEMFRWIVDFGSELLIKRVCIPAWVYK